LFIDRFKPNVLRNKNLSKIPGVPTSDVGFR